MKKFLLISLISLISLLNINLYSQKRDRLQQIATKEKGSDWVKFNETYNIKALDVFTNYYSFFGLRPGIDSMALLTAKSDAQGYTHYKYNQYYEGIPVEAAVYILHEFNGRVNTGNGHLIEGLNLNTKTHISGNAALKAALNFVNAKQYIWQDSSSQNRLKKVRKSASASYYPDPQLVIADKAFSGSAANYKLVYKMEVYAIEPLQRLQIYVDALNGEIYHTLNLLHNTDKQAQATTQYNGLKFITVDSFAANTYRLREEGRGGGVFTYTLQNKKDYKAAVDITSNTLNFTSDKVANQAHWSSEQTYDYYLTKFNRNSYDDEGAALISYVHYGKNYLNAFWDGTQMVYGDGGSGYGPFAALDVCGHEITHAVSGATAGFIYQNESGALSEMFSDIFGTAIEFFAVPAANWTIGENISTPFRSLSNPKKYQQPNTYKGQYWVSGLDDYGGVHTNCAVGNYWFYLLCKGGTGSNDKGIYYSISPLGMESAEKIAYRAMIYYLSPNSQYLDAYFATIQAAEDIFGRCSAEYRQTIAAWYATGVGYPLSNDKIFINSLNSPVTACGLSNEIVSLSLYYAGCDSVIQKGKKIVLAYKTNENILVYDTLILKEDMSGGDTIIFSFSKPYIVNTLGTHKISCYAKLGENTQLFNDSIIDYTFNNILHQNIDVGVVKALNPISNCGLNAFETVSCEFAFFGCDSIPKGETIGLSYQVDDNQPVIENYILDKTFYPSDILTYSFTTPADLSTLPGKVNIKVKTLYSKDTFNLNDGLSYTVIKPLSAANNTIGFDSDTDNVYYFINTTKYSQAFASAAARKSGTKGLQMTGGNALIYYNNINFPDSSNVWQVNPLVSAKISFCIDASNWDYVTLSFDLKQTSGGATYSMLFGEGDYDKTSSMRILVNDQQIGTTYNPKTYTSDLWKTHSVNLDQFAKSQFTLTIESRCICKDTTYYGSLIRMDNVYLDNIAFSNVFKNIKKINAGAFAASIYPMPAKDYYTINIDSDMPQSISIQTIDLFGKIVNSGTYNINSGNNRLKFYTDLLSNSVYFLKISSKTQTNTLKLIKAR